MYFSFYSVCGTWQEWTGEMKTREHELKESSSVHQSLNGLPAVRNVENSKTQNSHVSVYCIDITAEE